MTTFVAHRYLTEFTNGDKPINVEEPYITDLECGNLGQEQVAKLI